MVPIHELLNRIRWDAEFSRGEFELGYFDRVEGRIIVVPFREIDFPPDDPHKLLVLIDGRTVLAASSLTRSDSSTAFSGSVMGGLSLKTQAVLSEMFSWFILFIF